MKRISIFFVTVFILTAFGCDEFLDIEPKGLDIASTTDHYNGLFNNTSLFSYNNVRSLPGGVNLVLGPAQAPLFLSDDAVAYTSYLETASVSQQNMFKWLDEVYQPDEEANEWGAFYSQLYPYNLVIQDVMDSEGGTLQRKRELLAEARASRAFNLFLVSNLFGQPYNEATATTDLAVPITMKPDITQKSFKRATNKEFYDFIIKELTESIPDLNPVTTTRLRLARSGGYYMLGMVYFQMRAYQKAMPELKNALLALQGSTIPVSLYDYNTMMTTAPPAGWFIAAQPWRGASGYPLLYNSHEVIFLKQISNTLTISRNQIYVKPSVLNLYGNTDHRKKMFLNRNQSNGTITLPGHIRNSPGNINWGPGMPNLYLMLAECKARTNDLDGAKGDLETFRKTRMPIADASVNATTQDALIKFILDERQREFALTGFRWLDMRRLSGDQAYNNLDGTHQMDGQTFTFRNSRLTLKIPPFILAYNPRMIDNP